MTGRWRYAKDVPIRNWASYLATRFAYLRRRGGDSNREKRARRPRGFVEATVRQGEGSGGGGGAAPGQPEQQRRHNPAEKDRRPEWLAKQRELDALRRQLNQPATEPVA